MYQYQRHAQRYFAMLNNAVAISGDKALEGGLDAEALEYYQYLLKQDFPDCPLAFNLPTDQEKAIQQGIDGLVAIEALIDKKFKSPPKDLNLALDEIIQCIEKNCEESKACYLPAGWTSPNGGHYISMKARKLDNGHYAFSLLNHGAGMEYHQEVPSAGSKVRQIYQSDEYEIDLGSPKGRELLQRLIELRFIYDSQKDPHGMVNQYCADDLYGILKLYGKELPLTDKIDQKGVTPQREGSCTITNTHAAARDVLVNLGADLKTRKRYHFVLKLRSLLDGFEAYKAHDMDLAVLEWGLNEFSVRVLKEYQNVLTPEEVVYCGELQSKIQARLEEDKLKLLEEKTAALPFPNPRGEANPNQQVQIVQAPKTADTQEVQPDIKLERDFPASIAPEKLVEFIKKITVTKTVSGSLMSRQVIKTIGSLSIPELYQFMLSLPHCTGKSKDPYWDRVPVADMTTSLYQFMGAKGKRRDPTKIIKQLMLFSRSINLKDDADPLEKQKALAIGLMIYDIGAQLTMDDQYTLGLDDVYSDLSIFTDPEIYFTVKRIVSNFEERAKGRKRIFTNAVGLNGNDDDTVHYVVHVMLNREQRQKLMEHLGIGKSTDMQIFSKLMEDIVKHNNGFILEGIIGKNNVRLLQIAATAQACGKWRKGYQEAEIGQDPFYFVQTRYQLEAERQKHKIDFLEHLPEVSPENKEVEFQDCSESTLYHPHADLVNLQKKYEKAHPNSKICLTPYQLYPSGSLKPESEKWYFENGKKRLFEELNEEFRHIECAPHLQIGRTLAWLMNNPEKLAIKQVRTRINELLFTYGRLDHAFANQPELTLVQINDCLLRLLNHYQEEGVSDQEVLSWIAHLSLDLRHYAEVSAKVYDFKLDHFSLPSFQGLLSKALQKTSLPIERSELAALLVKGFQNKSPLSIDDCALLLTFRIIGNLGVPSKIGDEIWKSLQSELLDTIKKNLPIFNKKMNQLLHEHCGLSEDIQWKLNGSELSNNMNDFTIDLKWGVLNRRGIVDLKDYTGHMIERESHLFRELGVNINDIQLYGPLGGPITSTDGKWRFVIDYRGGIQCADQIISIDGKKYNFTLLSHDNRSKMNVFVSKTELNSQYLYWQSLDDPEVLLIKQVNSELACFYSAKTSAMVQYKLNENGDWQRTSKVILNLVHPTTQLETQWASRFKQIFGTNNIRCTAQFDENTQTCTLEKIEHLSLGLNFSLNKDGQLIWDENPGYRLLEQQSLKVLDGLPSVMILKNQKNETKILIPGFALKTGKNNYAFDQEDIVDHDSFCHESHPYFEYSLDAKGELVGKSVESNMYLAILYRSHGDYQRAFRYLEQCISYHNFTEATQKIAMQVLTHPIKSPMSAAFDLKLDCYLKEHSSKWTEESGWGLSDTWKKWIVKTQLPLYRKNFSHYKTGVAIIPKYCRLTPDELQIVGSVDSSKTVDQIVTNTNFTPSERQEKAARLPAYFLANYRYTSSPTDPSNDIRNLIMTYKKNYQDESHPLLSWRLFDERCSSGPAFGYLVCFFHEMLNDALSQNPDRINSLRQKLYALLMNDEKPHDYTYYLISFLAHAAKYPQFFKGVTLPAVDPTDKQNIHSAREALIIKVCEIFIKYKEEIGNKPCYLIDWSARKNSVPRPVPLPEDIKPNPVHYELGLVKEELACLHPLGNIAGKFFSKETRSVSQTEFALNASEMVKPTPLEKRLCEQYKRGHEENQTKQKIVYQANTNLQIEDLKRDLDSSKNADHLQLDKLKSSLERRANKIPTDHQAETYNILLARASDQRQVITVSELFTAFLKQDPNLLTQHNPFLTQEDIRVLFAELADYALLSSRVAQVDKALEDIGDKKGFDQFEPYELQLLASGLDKERAYEINKYPEFLVYEYATNRILRQDQVETLIKIIELLESNDPTQIHHSLLQFAAGGGKTSVLIPILANRFARKGYLPVILNTNELYETGLEDIPKNLRASLGQNMEVIERELDHQWKYEELVRLKSDLESWRKQGKCLLIKPVTWHSLNIARKLALFEKQNRLAQEIQAVLDFFKTKTIKLEDESHIISDPLQQSIKTYDTPLKPPQEQLNLMLRFYDHLMGYEPGSESIVSLAGIKGNQKQIVSKDNLLLLQSRLAEVIADEKCFSNLNRADLIAYLKQAERQRPAWLIDLHAKHPETADLVVLARAFIKTHLPHILTKQDYKDYGPSIHKGDLTVAPKHEGKDVTSHFGDHSLVVALTIQMYEQRGLTPDQINMLLDQLLKEHRKEREWNQNLNIRTQAEVWLSQFHTPAHPIRTYKDITQALRTHLSTDSGFFKNPLVIKRFLTQFALPQIEVPSMRQTSTAAELQAGFDRSLLLSATPGLPEIYPAILPKENCFLEEAFEAQVIETLLSPQNSKLVPLKSSQTPADFFEELPPDVFSTMTTLIDRGALLTDFKGQEIIESYLGLNEKRQNPSIPGVYFTKKETHLKSGNKTVDIPGTALVEHLKKQGIKPESFLLFLFMDLSKTTGVDIKRPFHDVAGLTVGKGQTVTDTIQAAMRERQLLDDNAQTVTWVMFQSLYREINPEAADKSFDLRQVFFWMIKNEAADLITKLINRAYQGIEHEITSVIWKEFVRQPYGFPDTHKDALKQKQSISPYDIYEQESSEVDTDKVLRQFAYDECERFDLNFEEAPLFYSLTKNIPAETRMRINKIISETATLIEKLQSPPKIQMNNEVQQEMKMQAEVKEEHKEELENTLKKNIDSATVFTFVVEKLDYKHVSALFNEEVKTLVLPGCEQIKHLDLQFSQHNFAAIQARDTSDDQKFDQLKPIKMLLVKIMPDGKMQYRACTAAEAEAYSVLLSNSSIPKTDPAYAIIGVDGSVQKISNNTNVQACRKWVKDPETQKMLVYAEFLSGQVNNPVILSELIKDLGWTKEMYEKMAKTIIPMMVSNETPTLLNHASLYSFCGWGKVTINPKDYASASEAGNLPTITMEPLHPVPVLKKPPGPLPHPVPRPERALEGYVFGEDPVPLKEASKLVSTSVTAII